MVDMRLVVNLATEPFFRSPTPEEQQRSGLGRDPLNPKYFFVRDYTGAAGTYVEVENLGEICSADTSIGPVEAYDYSGSWPPPAPPDPSAYDYSVLPPPPAMGRCEMALPRAGRPIVLLAVAGGDQEFDHWDDDPGTVCLGQGARCEIPEPPASDTTSLYAKAVFKTKAGDIRMGAFDGAEIRRGLSLDPPPRP